MTGLAYLLAGAAFIISLNFLKAYFTSFSAQRPADYAGHGEKFDLRYHLNGPIICEGVIYGPFGRVSSRFVGEFSCTWDANFGIMREKFLYDDGSIQDREWNLQLDENGTIKATASDVVGEGIGKQAGTAVQLKYKIRLPESAGGYVLDAIDWMYLAPNGTIVNRSQFRKFGIQVAELVATMRPATIALKEAAK